MKQRSLALLSALPVAVLLLTSCASGTLPSATEATTEATTIATQATTEDISTTTSATTEVTAAPEPEVTLPPVTADAALVETGRTNYQVIISDDADTDSTEMALARELVDHISSLTGATMPIKTDWLRSGTSHDASTYEILLGNTNYEETAQVAQAIGYGDYAIHAIGNKIVIFAYSDSALQKAVAKMTAIIDSQWAGKNIRIEAKWLANSFTANVKLDAMPLYEDGAFGAHYEAGGDCDEIIIRNTTPKAYEQYLEKVAAAGFTKYTSHTMAANRFATFTSEQYTLTAGYYNYESSVRILIEPLAPAVGLASENVYTPITTSQITMLGTAYQNKDSYVANGLSVLIRLTDGRFVIVDGGHNYVGCARELRDALREQSAAYAKSDKQITIAAWIITHAHGDHHGVLNSNYQVFQNMNVERVLINSMSETERQASINSKEFGANWSAGSGKIDKTLAAAKGLGATVYEVRVGQVFYLADLAMEILYTIESFAPNTCNALNTTSTVMRMQFGGENGTVYLSTGDATGNGMEICSDMYGEYLHADIVQVCHHGYSTWGNDAGMIKAYRTVNAPTLLWPQGYNAYLSSRTKNYNHVLFTVPNFKEVLVSGDVGDCVIVPIPYRVGSAEVIRAPK